MNGTPGKTTIQEGPMGKHWDIAVHPGAFRRGWKLLLYSWQANQKVESVGHRSRIRQCDVDILVIMPTRNQLDQAFKIRLALAAPFPLDLLVRKPKNIAWRLTEGELFHTEIMTRGKVLYEKGNAGMGAQGRSRLRSRRRAGAGRQAVS
jgi:hypothetical protein